ncbi:UDP-N-acetyl-D-mannosamine dehydrogenase [Lentibacillus sp. JNUCC-1]|uniref:nucleotide sugar dehydrogenase n=1 Tax=Lentibacillus sp. JNUCC-1 TaxID=2654513 RepID=UPI0012E8ADE5|nr:nucleotide sugar dehydrogenase [Lentibacillus sp. JNUCC-1]MUV37319.1 UDP-N-acetyl-D-mannosamine dehydrogenase [Lentibacillus sp. JNUCC-1]
MSKICVIGLGYIGLPTSIMFAKHGYEVHGMDVNENVIAMLQQKKLHIEEPGLLYSMIEAMDEGKLTVSTEPVKADIFVIAVPTPITDDKRANLEYVREGTKSIVPYVKKGDLVILESTVPPRTVEDVMRPILKETNLVLGEELYLAHSPERVIPGNIINELQSNDRIVGGIDETSGRLAKKLYESFVQGTIHLTDATTAEMVKVIENTFRDINIAFANELAVISEALGVNVWEAIKLANYHPRVNIHKPGPGVGGHCIAIDPWFLAEMQPEESKMIQLARVKNDAMPMYTVDRINDILKEYDDPKVALLGLSFKGNVDDMRESPALKVMEHMNDMNLSYKIFDPHIKDIRVPHQTETLDEALEQADMAVILTDHYQFSEYKPSEVGKAMCNKIVFDTKNCLDEMKWRQEGFDFIRLGDTKNR